MPTRTEHRVRAAAAAGASLILSFFQPLAPQLGLIAQYDRERAALGLEPVDTHVVSAVLHADDGTDRDPVATATAHAISWFVQGADPLWLDELSTDPTFGPAVAQERSFQRPPEAFAASLLEAAYTGHATGAGTWADSLLSTAGAGRLLLVADLGDGRAVEHVERAHRWLTAAA